MIPNLHIGDYTRTKLHQPLHAFDSIADQIGFVGGISGWEIHGDPGIASFIDAALDGQGGVDRSITDRFGMVGRLGHIKISDLHDLIPGGFALGSAQPAVQLNVAVDIALALKNHAAGHPSEL